LGKIGNFLREVIAMADCMANVRVEAVNVRSQPNVSASIVGIARRNDQLPVSDISAAGGDGFRWFEVTLPSNNALGWVREDLVQLSGNCADIGIVSTTPLGIPVDEEEEVPVTPPEGTVLVGDCQAEVRVFMARVRNQPNRNGDTLGMLRRATRFTVSDISAADEDGFQWYALDFNGELGWTREDLVTVTGDCLDLTTHSRPPISEEDPAEVEPVAATCAARIDLNRVNVRAQPTTTSAVVGRAEANQVFEVKDITDPQPDGFNWVLIDFNGVDGFIRFDLIGLEGDCSDLLDDVRLPAPVAANISQGFKSNHPGLDFPIPAGTELKTTVPCRVVRSHECRNCAGTPSHIFSSDPNVISQIFSDSDWGFGYGEHVILQIEFEDLHPTVQQELFNNGANPGDSVFVLYAHMDRRDVDLNQRLDVDAILGCTGHTGFSTAPHLHLEVATGRTWETARKLHPGVLFLVQRV
jgi:hypothetical protein